MTKPIMQVTHCEQCGGLVTLESPPCKERYNNAEIHISSGTLLFPPSVIKRNHKDGYADSHATSLEGYYCHAECLIKRINSLLFRGKKG